MYPKKRQRKLSVYTDTEYVIGLKNGDNRITRQFFHEEIAGTLREIQYSLFGGRVEYDELVHELYLYLRQSDWHKLDTFVGANDASLHTWVNTVAWRYFFNIRNRLDIHENQNVTAQDVAYDPLQIEISMDVQAVLSTLKNRRYAEILELMLIDGRTAKEVANRWGITCKNVYNIKHRAIVQFVRVYGKR